MAGSGVLRKRMSAKNHPLHIEHVSQPEGRYTGAPRVADPMSPKAPAKYRPFETTQGKFPTTPPPKSAEEPVRGEGPVHRHTARSK